MRGKAISLLSLVVVVLTAVSSSGSVSEATINVGTGHSRQETVASYQVALASPDDWPTVQKNPQRTGYASESVEPPYFIKWTWNTNQAAAVRISGKTQPVVSQGMVFIGAYDGRLYALDANSGAQLWSFPTGGPIFHSAAADGDGRVYFGSDDKYIYAVDITTGQCAWAYRTGAGVWVAPLVVDGVVYAGSRDGYFYALDAASGRLRWRFKTGGPILNTAAYSNGRVFFGSDDMYAYALGASDGVLQWRTKLPGQSFRDYWPVVSEKQNVVIFRTMPVYPHLDMLDAEFSAVLEPTRNQGFEAEIAAAVSYLRGNRARQSLFVLDLVSGRERYVAPVLWTGGVGGPAAPPVIDPTGDKAYLVTLSNQGYWLQAGGFYDFRSAAALALLNLSTGDIAIVQPNPPASPSNPQRAFRLIGDETSSLSLLGSSLYVSMSQGVGKIDLSTGALSHAIHEMEPPLDGFTYATNLAIFDRSESLAFSSESTSAHLAPAWAPAIVSHGAVFWKSDGGALVALVHQQR